MIDNMIDDCSGLATNKATVLMLAVNELYKLEGTEHNLLRRQFRQCLSRVSRIRRC